MVMLGGVWYPTLSPFAVVSKRLYIAEQVVCTDTGC